MPESLPPSSDRRRTPRERRESAPGFMVIEGGRSEVAVFDISSNGAGLTTTSAHAVGDVVLLRIGIGPGRVPQRCRVVRCEPLPDGTFSIGVEFVDTSPKFLNQQRLSA
ncbi:MAG: PilZ domain-containing protein [Tepidisphaeraceae bacterium]